MCIRDRKIILVCFLFLNLNVLFGQKIEQPQFNDQTSLLRGLSISGNAYPISALGELHKSFLLKYVLSTATQVELQGFYDTYTITERFRSSLLGKVYINEKLYLFSGLEAEVATENTGLNTLPYRFGFFVGAGYDISNDLTLEMKSNIQLQESNIGSYGETEINMPAIHTISAKWKF